MSNHHLRNTLMSLKGKGMMSLMLSLPENWDFTTKGLASICKDGVDSISATLRELEQHGYLTRERLRDAHGRVGDIVYTMTTDWWGEAESGTLYYGDYYLQELEAADGYELIDTPIPFSISEQDMVLEIPITNPMIVGGISVLKLSGWEPPSEPSMDKMDVRYWGEPDEEHQPLSGAVFGIYTEWGYKIAEMVSDENGEASYFGLPQGYYYLKELTAPEGYILVDELIPFGIYEQGDICEWVVYNPEGFGTIEVQKSGENEVLPGVAFDVYRTSTDEKVGSLVTDSEGLASLMLPLGRYYLVETATAPGYALLPGRVSFTLTVDGETVELPILNQKAQVGCDKGQLKCSNAMQTATRFCPARPLPSAALRMKPRWARW